VVLIAQVIIANWHCAEIVDNNRNGLILCTVYLKDSLLVVHANSIIMRTFDQSTAAGSPVFADPVAITALARVVPPAVAEDGM
jgi:hypothetical protein